MLAENRPEWLTKPLPDEVISDIEWLKVMRFFVLESPCLGQSNRQKDISETWGKAPWISSRYLKVPLNLAVFGVRTNEPFVKVESKSKVSEALDKQNLSSGFPSSIEHQRAVFTKASGKGNSSVYMSLFYHIRNAIAHARFGLMKDAHGKFIFIFEDGRLKRDQGEERFELTARGIIRLESLFHIVDVIESGPGAKPDIEEQILSAMQNGIDTKKKIMGELEIPEEDWRTYSQVLRKEGKIICAKQKWSVT